MLFIFLRRHVRPCRGLLPLQARPLSSNAPRQTTAPRVHTRGSLRIRRDTDPELLCLLPSQFYLLFRILISVLGRSRQFDRDRESSHPKILLVPRIQQSLEIAFILQFLLDLVHDLAFVNTPEHGGATG